MSRPHAVQTSWTPYPHPGAPVFRHAFALETFASEGHRDGPLTERGGEHGLGGLGGCFREYLVGSAFALRNGWPGGVF